MKYKVERNEKHILKSYPETVKAFGCFVGTSALTALYYGIITSPSMAPATVEQMARDNAGGPLIMFGAISVGFAISTINNFRLERRKEKLRARLEARAERENAYEDMISIYNEIQDRKRFENIEKQTDNLFSK
ncbi:MAG: DUF3395 domain-containing protein [Firmicutes bacterium]|nr:DUF3395 domain-containing protein [Bacillota bacterium]